MREHSRRSSSDAFSFFRIHLLYFMVTPCIAAAIMYASNGDTPISYVDALFMCVSAMTVTGLNSVLVAPLSRWQQGILFILMTIGSTSVVSLVTIKIRQHFFRKAFRQIIHDDPRAARKARDAEKAHEADHQERKRERKSIAKELWPRASKKPKQLTTSMIRRVDDPTAAARRVGNDGQVEESSETSERTMNEKTAPERPASPTRMRRQSVPNGLHFSADEAGHDHISFPDKRSRTHEPVLLSTSPEFNRAPTIDVEHEDPQLRRRTVAGDARGSDRSDRMPWTATREAAGRARDSGFGGFPNPVLLAVKYLKTYVPSEGDHWNNLATKSMHRTQTQGMGLGRTGTITSTAMGRTATKPAPYISFDAQIGRNSTFRRLTKAQQEELGGVEYRALSTLFWIVFAYIFGWQLLMCTILSPYLSRSEFSDIFDAPTGTSPTWFTFFQIWSAWSNNGMSLLDASMIPFQYTYLLIVLMAFTIYAGNARGRNGESSRTQTAYPVFLRLFIWLGSLCVPATSRMHETLQFILDHPRRVYIYLCVARRRALTQTAFRRIRRGFWSQCSSC